MILKSGKKRPGRLLNILQCTGEPPQQRVVLTQMLIVPRLKNPELDIKWTLREKMEEGRGKNVVFVFPLSTQVKGRMRKEKKRSSLKDLDKFRLRRDLLFNRGIRLEAPKFALKKKISDIVE